jgi:hypothetical protein
LGCWHVFHLLVLEVRTEMYNIKFHLIWSAYIMLV